MPTIHSNQTPTWSDHVQGLHNAIRNLGVVLRRELSITPAPTWSDKTPTVPGWYWVRSKTHRAHVREICRTDNGKLCYYGDRYNLVEPGVFRFAGPIHKPVPEVPPCP